jgi:hypothetical protein
MFSSCVSSGYIVTDETNIKHPETSPSKILVFSTADAGREYLKLGEVVVKADANTQAMVPVGHLKKQASILGADAIINLKLKFTMGVWATGLEATGTAVKFVNP